MGSSNNPFNKNQTPLNQKRDMSPMSSVKSGSNDGGSIKDKAGSQGSFNFQKKYTRKCPFNLYTFVSRGGPGICEWATYPRGVAAKCTP
jgi:hypothetical protein